MGSVQVPSSPRSTRYAGPSNDEKRIERSLSNAHGAPPYSWTLQGGRKRVSSSRSLSRGQVRERGGEDGPGARVPLGVGEDLLLLTAEVLEDERVAALLLWPALGPGESAASGGDGEVSERDG